MAISTPASLPRATFSLLSSRKSSPLTTSVSLSHNSGRLSYEVRRRAVVSCLNLPLKPRSPAGKSLSSVLQNEPQSFYDAVSTELNRIIQDRDAALDRFQLSFGSPEASLHRRIAKLKESECQLAVEDVLYMIILYKFSEIRVPMIPSLSKCLYNGRLEILPSKDWELESIYSRDVLEMVREHLSTVIGWNAGSSVAVNWSTTKIQRLHLNQAYASSITYGYFLKSASTRFQLEQNLPLACKNVPFGNWTPSMVFGPHGLENAVVGQTATPRSTTVSQVSSTLGKREEKLRCYLNGFDLHTRQVCAKLKSEEAADLIDKHCSALFASDMTRDPENDEILTSLSSLKRLVLEAVAFGCFLWDAEQHVSGIYRLKERY